MDSPADDPVSPELALVDSTLRDRLREVEAAEPHRHPKPASPDAGAEPTVRLEPPRSRRSRTLPLAVVITAAALGAGAVWYALHRPAAASTTTAASATTSQASGTAGGDTGSRPSGRTFAWAPVKGVSAYDVEIRRNGAVVYSARTNVSHIHIPAQLKRAGRKLTLSPGTYRWYVWPVGPAGRAGRRGRAIVATTFEITR